MKIQFLAILALSVLLYSCSLVDNSSTGAECITGRIVFTKYRDANNIYMLDLQSKEESILYNDPTATGFGGVEWSPDGSSISFSRYSGDNSDIYILTLDNSSLKQITNTPDIELSPSWSPDGKHILTTSVIDEYGQLLNVRIDDSRTEQITNGNWHFYHASWSPDGKKIVYISDKDMSGGIYIMNSDGGEQYLLNEEISGSTPKWSPDGNYISFNSKSLSVKTRIVLYNMQDQTFSLLVPGDTGDTNEIGYSYGAAMWSKNGKCVMFIKGEGESEFLHVMDFASREMFEIIDIGLTDSIDWYSE